jgi:hypothetical protein
MVDSMRLYVHASPCYFPPFDIGLFRCAVGTISALECMSVAQYVRAVGWSKTNARSGFRAFHCLKLPTYRDENEWNGGQNSYYVSAGLAHGTIGNNR